VCKLKNKHQVKNYNNIFNESDMQQKGKEVDSDKLYSKIGKLKLKNGSDDTTTETIKGLIE